MGEQYSYYPLTYTRAKGIFPAYRQGGRSRTMRESCYCQKVAIGLDGRQSRPATDGKPCAAGKVATTARFFYRKGKHSSMRAYSPIRAFCVFWLVSFSHVHRENRCSTPNVAMRAYIPAAVLFSGRNALHRRILTVVALLRGCNREVRSVPLDRASRNATLSLWKGKSCFQRSALSIGFYAAMGAARIEVGDATSPLYPLPMGTSRTKRPQKEPAR